MMKKLIEHLKNHWFKYLMSLAIIVLGADDATNAVQSFSATPGVEIPTWKVRVTYDLESLTEKPGEGNPFPQLKYQKNIYDELTITATRVSYAIIEKHLNVKDSTAIRSNLQIKGVTIIPGKKLDTSEEFD